MVHSFIVPEEHALGQYYLYHGIWEIMTRTQLLDGRWLIECRKKDWCIKEGW